MVLVLSVTAVPLKNDRKGWKVRAFLLLQCVFIFVGCKVYSDRRVSSSRSRAAKLLGPGWPAE